MREAEALPELPLVADVAPLEVLAHRALWSFAMLALLIGWLGRWAELRRELRSPKLLAMLSLTSLLIAVNWLTFIYAVITRQLLQASLGYFDRQDRRRVAVVVTTDGRRVHVPVDGDPLADVSLLALLRSLPGLDGLLGLITGSRRENGGTRRNER